MNKSYKIAGKALELSNAFGYLFPGEVYLLGALAQSLKDDAVVVNIGAGVGTSALAMVEMHPKLRIFTIDISPGGPLGGMLNEASAFRSAHLPVPQQIVADSQIVHSEWPNIGHGEPIDLLFIDGDHTVEGLKRDIAGWLKYVSVGGYSVFHDYKSFYWGDVTAIVDQAMKPAEWQLVLAVDTMIAFQRLEPIVKKGKAK